MELWQSMWKKIPRVFQSWGVFSDIWSVLLAHARHVLTQRLKSHSFSPHTLECSFTVMKCLQTGNTGQSFSSLTQRHVFLLGRNSFLYFYALLQLLFKLSVYEKDGALRAALILLSQTRKAGFSSLSTDTFKDCTFLPERGAKGNLIFALTSCPNMFLSSHKQVSPFGVLFLLVIISHAIST